MSAQTVTLTLPEDVYRRLEQMAEAIHLPVEEVAYQTMRGNLPPIVDDVLPELKHELAALQSLGDEDLWRVVQEPIPPASWRKHQLLLHRSETGTLNETQHATLNQLRTATDHFVIRRSFALALLKWRGHTLPTPPVVSARASPPKNSRRRSSPSR
jgi:hypothetical protein